MSNVLLAINAVNNKIDKYLNATNEIICINSICENILQKLAGADFDSDSILLCDNEILINAARKNYDNFKVAVCNVSGIKKKRTYTTYEMSDLDNKTSTNLIGDIINVSQELNSIIYDRLSKGASFDEVQDVYLDVCKLSILSGLEIDKAKKEFVINSTLELKEIREKHKILIDGKSVKPKFFAHLSKQKGYYNKETRNYLKHKTSMDYLQECANSFRLKREGIPKSKIIYLPFSDVIKTDNYNIHNVSYQQINEVLSEAERLKRHISNIYSESYLSMQDKVFKSDCLRQQFNNKLGKLNFNSDTIVSLLKRIELDEHKKYKTLFFYGLFGYPNTSFYDAIIKSHTKINNSDNVHNIQYYGHNLS